MKEHVNLLLFNYCQLIKLHSQPANWQIQKCRHQSARTKSTKSKLAYATTNSKVPPAQVVGNVAVKLTKVSLVRSALAHM